MTDNRKATPQEAVNFLKKGTYGVLSLADKSGTPYGIPMNYVFVPEDNAVYFHCARTGRKLDLIRQNSRASFAVVAQEHIQEDRFITHYDSVIVTGTISPVKEDAQKREVLKKLCARLTPTAMGQSRAVIEQYLPAVAILRFAVASITGKSNRDA